MSVGPGPASIPGSGQPDADPAAAPRPAVFLDRDGTIIEDRHYLSDPAGVALIEGAAEGLRRFRDAGFALVVVTNQSGIARGLFDHAAFLAVQQRLAEVLAAESVTLDGTWYCPHHPDHTGPCGCRKPALRMFEEAAETLGLDLRRSIYIGDRVHDIVPALSFGGTPVLVRTGYGRKEAAEVPAGTVLADDLADAAERVLSQRDRLDSGESPG